MRLDTMIVLLLLVYIVYVIVSYKKLVQQHTLLNDLATGIKQKEALSQNTDRLRREYNAIARAYNHTLEGFIGGMLAQKLKYEKKKIIEKI